MKQITLVLKCLLLVIIVTNCKQKEEKKTYHHGRETYYGNIWL